MEYLRKHKVDVRLVRIFNTYGPRLQKDDGRVISNFINQALNHKPLTVYGSGRQTRSFCYIDDMVEGIIRAAFRTKTRGQIFNLGNPVEFSILEAVKLVQSLVEAPLEIDYRPLPSDDPQRRRPDISRAHLVLNWFPKIQLKQGLSRTIEWFRNGV